MRATSDEHVSMIVRDRDMGSIPFGCSSSPRLGQKSLFNEVRAGGLGPRKQNFAIWH